jgi:hypothetical protein
MAQPVDISYIGDDVRERTTKEASAYKTISPRIVMMNPSKDQLISLATLRVTTHGARLSRRYLVKGILNH